VSLLIGQASLLIILIEQVNLLIILIGQVSLLIILISSLTWIYWTSSCREPYLLNRNKNSLQNILTTKRARITDWSRPPLSDIKALLGVVINMSPYPVCDIIDYFSQAWLNKMRFFSNVFRRDGFLLLFVMEPTFCTS
jgi:hypothetical protein